MAKVRATATMYIDLEWIGEVPDDIPEDNQYWWVRENIDGDAFVAIGNGEWSLHDVEPTK
jgi:hypothetical protein